jgi:2,4-diaminopentanoate dehydrogenase
LAPHEINARAGVIRAGTVAATSWQFHGLNKGNRVISLSVNWVMGKEVPGFEIFNHWNIAIQGKPSIEIKMDLVESPDTQVKTRAAQYGVAGAVINAIPHVVAAPPGLYRFSLPPVFSKRLARAVSA